MYREGRPARRGSPRLLHGLLTIGLVVTALGVVFTGPARADTTGTPPPEAYILVDAGTGAVITERNMHEALPTASIAKIMTALVAVERLPPDATIDVDENAANREAMKIGMQAGSRWPFQQAMASMMMVSANDAAYAIAETVGGSIPGFAADLNATARRYGMKDSTFSDPAGLTDTTSYDGGPKVSAYDMAIATRNALSVPFIAKWADTVSYDFTDSSGVHHELTNHDKFLPGNGFGYTGANGFKTGYTEIADHTLVATAKRDGRQCIAVILGSTDSGYTWAASLLDQCWIKPAVATTGVFLPPVRVSPYEDRVATRAAFTQLAVGKTGAALAAKGTKHDSKRAPPANPQASSRGHHGTPPGNPGSGSSSHKSNLASARTSVVAAGSHGGGPLTLNRFALLFVLVLAAAVVLRRRAVKRQRARRRERQRARAKAMRSGSLPVVDGRYRTGTRVGPPLESHVRVERTVIDLTEVERAEAEGRPSDLGIA